MPASKLHPAADQLRTAEQLGASVPDHIWPFAFFGAWTAGKTHGAKAAEVYGTDRFDGAFGAAKRAGIECTELRTAFTHGYLHALRVALAERS